MSASAKNMEVVYKAKKTHDANCPFGGEGKRVHLHPFDIERMGWEEGDVIAGLLVVSNTEITTGMIRVECDAESGSGGPTIEEEVKEDVKKEDLVPV